MAKQDAVVGFTTGIFAIPAGASNALFVRAAPGEQYSWLKYASGGSLEIIGASLGSTGAVTAGTGYLLAATEIFNIKGPAAYYLCATGATSLAYFAKGLSEGF